MKQDGYAHDDPKNQAANSHSDNNTSKSTLHGTHHRPHIEESRHILAAKGYGADAIAVRPARVIEGREKVLKRVITAAVNEFVGGTPGIQRFGVNREAAKKGLRIYK